MKKSRLLGFINRHFLGGNIPSVILKSGDTLSTRFVSEDRTLLGEVSMDD